MSISIETTLNVTNETYLRTNALIDLVTSKIGYIRQGYHGHRPIGKDDLVFPCVMVECVDTKATMTTTGKFTVRWTVHLYYYVVSSNRDDLIRKQTDVMEALVKLLSNNALGDGSNQYKTYPGFWLDSEMKEMSYSGTFAWEKPDKADFARAGRMVLELLDVVVK